MCSGCLDIVVLVVVAVAVVAVGEKQVDPRMNLSARFPTATWSQAQAYFSIDLSSAADTFFPADSHCL